jgi:hypothetical protein
MNNNLTSINSLNSSTDRVVLLPKNPGMFFVFWQFSDARTKLFMSGSYKNEIVLKLFNAQDRTCLPAVAQDSIHRQAGIAEFKFRWDTFKAYISYPVTPSGAKGATGKYQTSGRESGVPCPNPQHGVFPTCASFSEGGGAPSYVGETVFLPEVFLPNHSYPKNARLPSNLSSANVFEGGQATSIYAVAFVETVSGSIETLAESNVFAICPASAGAQNFLTDNSEYYRKVVT